MKRLFQVGLCLAASILACSGRTTDAEAPLPDVGFPVGESLTYDMHYGLLHVGTTVVTTEWITEQGRPLILIRFVTRTNKLFDKVYRVDDLVESVIDPVTFLPVRFQKRLHEGDFVSEELTVFDYQARKAHWQNKLTGRSQSYEINPDTRDIVAFMYSMRKAKLERGSLGDYWVAGDEGMCQLTLKGRSTRPVNLPRFGEVQALRIEPRVAKDQLFVRKMPRELWVSTDERRIIIKMAVKVPVAHIVLTLRDVGGPGDDFWTRRSQGSPRPVLARDD